MVRALDLNLVVPGSALHPIAHCFVFGCPKIKVSLGKWSVIIIIIIIVIEL